MITTDIVIQFLKKTLLLSFRYINQLKLIKQPMKQPRASITIRKHPTIIYNGECYKYIQKQV